MSDEKIDHAAEAVKFIDQNVWREAGVLYEHIPSLIARAQVHATLALVEQQRIANLIALASSEIGELVSAGMGGLTEHQPHPDYVYTVMVPTLRPEVRKGLGL